MVGSFGEPMTDAQKIRQLERQLTECDSISPVDGARKIDILNDLAWALSDTDLQRAVCSRRDSLHAR